MFVIHSFTPSGVEHALISAGLIAGRVVIHSFTPSGVEHRNISSPSEVREKVIHSFTPSGVEHLQQGRKPWQAAPGDSFVYAVRR